MKMQSVPEYRTQVSKWFVETGYCDGGSMGWWTQTEESIEVSTKVEAERLRDEWLATGKLVRMRWGELRPTFSYGLFRIRQEWVDVDLDSELARLRDALAQYDSGTAPVNCMVNQSAGGAGE